MTVVCSECTCSKKPYLNIYLLEVNVFIDDSLVPLRVLGLLHIFSSSLIFSTVVSL